MALCILLDERFELSVQSIANHLNRKISLLLHDIFYQTSFPRQSQSAVHSHRSLWQTYFQFVLFSTFSLVCLLSFRSHSTQALAKVSGFFPHLPGRLEMPSTSWTSQFCFYQSRIQLK